MNPHRVILCLRGGVGGVDVFSCNLIRELLNRGVDSKIILTTSAREFIPSDIPVDELPIQKKEGWPSRWRKMIRYLENQAPCIFIPNYDFNYSCISPKLSEKIIIVGIVHSDEENYYADTKRLGKYWNGVVAVSQTIRDHLISRNGFVLKSLATIPYGVPVPQVIPERKARPDSPLRIVYVGRLVQMQKRIFDLPDILAQLNQRNVKAEITIIGDGGQRVELLQRLESFLASGQVQYLGALRNDQVLQNLENQDVILLTSEYEGMPICILEAMSRGCIPIVTAIRSGIPELVQDGYNGFVVGIGDAAAFADRIGLLSRDLTLRRLTSSRAAQTIAERFNIQKMTDEYLQFFQSLQKQMDRGDFQRPKNQILIPPDLNLSWKQYLPASVRRLGIHSRRFFRKITGTKPVRLAKKKGSR